MKGYRLYVELGASQARRRLKHFGHGVRKVEAVGRNQSVIIHTATGEHLRELEAFLADVLPTPRDPSDGEQTPPEVSGPASPGAEEE
jgi:hypothetical protein